MASKPRSFQADVPVEVASRCVHRLPMLNRKEIKHEVRRLIAKYTAMCKVEVPIYAIERNHLHLLLVQHFSGHDPTGRIGISPMMRDLLSGVARYGNGFLSFQGAFVERSFRSWACGTPEEILHQFGYIASNLSHHEECEEFIEDEDSGFAVYSHQAPDGVVNSILGIFGMMSKDPEVRGEAILQLVREMYAAPDWETNGVEVAQRAFREHPELDRGGAFTTFAVGLWVGEEMAERARDALLKSNRKKVDFRPRRPSELGEIPEIIIRNEHEEPPPPPKHWLEDDR